MPEILLFPIIAFVLYCILVGVLSGMGRLLAPHAANQSEKSTIYAGGEAPPRFLAAPGYAPFFIVALFFAMLHVGALILGNASPSPAILVFIVGLALTLFALILG